MKPKRTTHLTSDVKRMRVPSLLRELGVKVKSKKVRSKSFWIKNEHQLYELLHEAWMQFRRLMVRVHPDKPGGNLLLCQRLNMVWSRIKRAFAKQGVRLNA